MRRSMRIAATLCMLLAAASACAQRPKFYWSVDMAAVFDNREGDKDYADTKTFFQTQLAPEIGISLCDGRHLVAGGAVWTQPIGCEWKDYHISPTLYYLYRNHGLRFAMGMFGKEHLLAEMPNYIWNDSVNYTQRNIRGAMVAYNHDKGYIQAFIDWRGMQTETQREAFNIIVSGERRYKDGKFMWGGLLMMNHLALDKSGHNKGQNVVDNFLYNPYIGIDVSRLTHTPLDSCAIRVGALGGFTRDRGDNHWKTPAGVWVDIDVAWRFLELKNTFYAGGKLFPYYGNYGVTLDQGEPYYAAPLYNRTSLMGYFLKLKFMRLKASLDFNAAPSHFNFYQRLILTFSF